MKNKVFCKNCDHITILDKCNLAKEITYNPVVGEIVDFQSCYILNRNFDCPSYKKVTIWRTIKQIFYPGLT